MEQRGCAFARYMYAAAVACSPVHNLPHEAWLSIELTSQGMHLSDLLDLKADESSSIPNSA
jgi:hypothetical protein